MTPFKYRKEIWEKKAAMYLTSNTKLIKNENSLKIAEK